MSPKPERRFELGIRVGGDDLPAIARALRAIAYCCDHTQDPTAISGGSDAYYCVKLRAKENPDVTHDSYFKAVDAWIEAEEQREPTGSPCYICGHDRIDHIGGLCPIASGTA